MSARFSMVETLESRQLFTGTGFTVTFGGPLLTQVPPTPMTGMLLPAVQKVREAAAKVQPEAATPPPAGTVTFIVDSTL